MQDSYLTQSLNPQQTEAVTAPPSNMLILAGAGSGKTRVLVHRIAWLMERENISPYGILAVTFTNKASHEMRSRIESLCGMPIAGIWVGTFHGLAHRLLRTHWEAAELPEGFQILDSDDQQRMIKRIHKTLALDETKWPPKQSQWFINQCKEKGQRPRHLTNNDDDYFTETMATVYQAYEDVCRRSGLVDFAELLLRSLELLQTHTDIAEHYQNRFQHILVDEFQDTNTIQYRWLKTIAGKDSFMMAVGDDDQSIYSWRGAKVENMDRFTTEYPDAKTIRLEQNYRSTQTILNAANTVIDNNQNRLGKNLWTEDNGGEKITLYAAFNERDEAYYIVNAIKQQVRAGNHYRDTAILYRSNAQSRVLEERLIDAQIAYRIYGGLKFFERAEIKDALAYLRLITNRQDDAAFERIVNTPTRGIGNTTLITLRNTARESQASLWQACEHLITAKGLSARACSALQSFLTLINTLDNDTRQKTLDEQTDHVLQCSGLLDMYRKDKTEKGLSRVENLEELVNATSQFHPNADAADLSPLSAFLAHVALESGEGQSEAHSDYVSLMTLHSAKGLEFPIVFISGMEEDLFPHKMSSEEPAGLEEERRLCYVGMTRAMKKLYLTHAESRRLHGYERFHRPSRFLQEIPEEHLDTVRPTAKVSRPKTSSNHFNTQNFKRKDFRKMRENEGQQAGASGLHVGQRVRHKKFGNGIIINYEGQGEHTRVQVKFDDYGVKWLVASYANLEAA